MTSPIPVSLPVKLLPKSLQARPFRRREWLFRLVIVVLLVASIALVWWSLKFRLLPAQKQSRELSTSVTRLSTEVDDLERQWSKARQDEINRRLKQAHAQLFSDQDAVESWLSNIKTQSDPLLLDAKAALGKSIPKTTNGQEVAIIPAIISVSVAPIFGVPDKESPYQRILRFSERLAAVQKRADLIELTVLGGTNSVSSAALVFHLWAGEGNPP
jgi:cell division protein FtsB